MTQKDTLAIFLSYANADKVYAQILRQLLLSQRPNLRIFSTERLDTGEDWESRLRDELNQCDLFVVLLSPNSIDSEWVLYELGAAWAINKPIIPVVTQPEILSKIPVALQGVQSVEIENLGKPEVINQIFERYEEMVTPHNTN